MNNLSNVTRMKSKDQYMNIILNYFDDRDAEVRKQSRVLFSKMVKTVQDKE